MTEAGPAAASITWPAQKTFYIVNIEPRCLWRASNTVIAEEHRVSIRRTLRDCLNPEHSTGADFVLNDDLLTDCA
jgi:hypothetical protein